ncbi:hypothetical protein JX265_006923 [Neoarthrinium moseri]|uniref:Zn(2)-C6 fungal-type domain-containing protein n=1 Tax=Neoarthrinium moseri TaxID=1658444 RepID=A0A9Q0AQ26_9PEZI|nr:hypothetical protein JX265_006923 [Neoarthrinium moseri]
MAIRPRKKRSQVARACDWCRVHRVKCDSDQPCSNCRKRGGHCSNNGTNKIATLPQAFREIENLRSRVEELEQQLHQERSRAKSEDDVHQLHTPPSLALSASPEQHSARDNAAVETYPLKRFWEGIQINTARSSQKTWFGPSSLFFFIGRMNNFLSLALHQTHSANHMLPNSASKLMDGPATHSMDDQARRSATGTAESINAGKYLSPTQEEYFLGLFWQSYHTAYPILDEIEFKEHYRSLWTTSSKVRKPSALVDIVIALCMQYGMALLRDARREISAASRATVDNNDATISGRWHYERSQTLLASDLESPTIATLQCHILSSIYLCCGSFQNISDGACALAVRTAYMLGLHLDPPEGMPQRQKELRRRLWWVLYVLESKMSMKLGRPFLTHSSATACNLPDDHHKTAMLSGSSFAPLGEDVTWLTWNIHNTKLMLVARAAHTALYDKDPKTLNVPCTAPNIWEDSRLLEAYAEFMAPHMKQLADWASDVPDVLRTGRQGGIPLSTDRSILDIEQFAPLWLQRQRLLLELLFHNLSLGLYRPFVSFIPAAAPTPFASRSATKCAEHAMALTHIMHQVICSTAILAGWHEAFQWQWNAAMTLLGFVLAEPQNDVTPFARKAIDLSAAVFETFGDSFAIAASAANIVRELCAKIDIITERSMPKKPAAIQLRPDPVAQEVAQIPLAAGSEPLPAGIVNSFVPGLQPYDGYMNFDNDAAVAMQGFLEQSIDAMLGVEMYNSFDADFENLMSNVGSNDEWSFTQQ